MFQYADLNSKLSLRSFATIKRGNFNRFWKFFESFANMLHHTSPSYWMWNNVIISFKFYSYSVKDDQFFWRYSNQRPIQVTLSNGVILTVLGVTLFGQSKLPQVWIKCGECLNKTKYFYVHIFDISNSHAVSKFPSLLTIFGKCTILDVWLVLATPLVLLTIFVTLIIIII